MGSCPTIAEPQTCPKKPDHFIGQGGLNHLMDAFDEKMLELRSEFCELISKNSRH